MQDAKTYLYKRMDYIEFLYVTIAFLILTTIFIPLLIFKEIAKVIIYCILGYCFIAMLFVILFIKSHGSYVLKIDITTLDNEIVNYLKTHAHSFKKWKKLLLNKKINFDRYHIKDNKYKQTMKNGIYIEYVSLQDA